MIEIDCVLFDYGGVLCPLQDPLGQARMAKMLGFEVGAFVRLWRQYRPSYDHGVIDGATYWSRVMAHSRVTGLRPEDLIAEEIPTWYGLDEALLDWAWRLREAGIRTGVLSNMPPELVADTRRRDWIAPFEPLFFSADLHVIKPYAPIYEHAVAKTGCSADRILFLDDRPENVRGALRAGMHALCYRGLARMKAKLEPFAIPDP